MGRKGIGAFDARKLGQYMRLVREKKGLETEALARRLGVTVRRLRLIEAGKTEAQLDEWLAFCRVVDLTPWGEPSRGYWARLRKFRGK